MKNKRILTLTFVVVAIALLFSGCCPVCPDIPEYDCPDVTVDCPEIPTCPDIPVCPACPDVEVDCPACPNCECPDIPACALAGSLFAQDFGWAEFSLVIGYSAGFGLVDATFEDAQMVMRLYAGTQLLQTNTLISGHDMTGWVQISSPFDVFGTFDYVADGYWTNIREVEYGQTVPATKVIATVTLNNSKIVTAENTNPTNMP